MRALDAYHRRSCSAATLLGSKVPQIGNDFEVALETNPSVQIFLISNLVTNIRGLDGSQFENSGSAGD
jgi:hypothetical protein